MKLRTLSKRQMRLAASGSIGELWDAPWKARNMEVMIKPWPRGLQRPANTRYPSSAKEFRKLIQDAYDKVVSGLVRVDGFERYD